MTGLTIDFGDSVNVEHRRGKTIDEDWIDAFFRRCREYGVDTVLWRVSECGVVSCRSRMMEMETAYCGYSADAMEDVLYRFDPPKVAVDLAHRHGIRIFIWLTIADFYGVRPVMNLDAGFLDVLREQNLTLWKGSDQVHIAVDPFWNARPELCWTSRDGRCRYRGVPSLAFEENVSRLLDHIDEMSEHGPDGIHLSSRTHSKDPHWYGYDSDEADGFGFEEPVRKEFLERYGQDIRMEDFDREAWQRLKGEHLTSFLRRVKERISGRMQQLYFGTKPDRYSYLWTGTGTRTDYVRLYKDWETWSREGILDGLVLITDRTVVDDLDFVQDYLNDVAPSCQIFPWMNFNVPPMHSLEEIRRMRKAARDVGAPGILFHEADDLRVDDGAGDPLKFGGTGDFSDEAWGSLSPEK